MDTSNEDFIFYKQSLLTADHDVYLQAQTGKALKDIVGVVFEQHRKRIWEHFGFTVSKDRHDALFDVDWSITYNGTLVALEEDKGHYVDSCFLERALSGFCKTINMYQSINKPIPSLILHSFTRYKKFSEKLKEDMDTRKPSIVDEIQKKFVYTTLTSSDRLSKSSWFSKDSYNCYSNNADDLSIFNDILFIRSLIPHSE